MSNSVEALSRNRTRRTKVRCVPAAVGFTCMDRESGINQSTFKMTLTNSRQDRLARIFGMR